MAARPRPRGADWPTENTHSSAPAGQLITNDYAAPVRLLFTDRAETESIGCCTYIFAGTASIQREQRHSAKHAGQGRQLGPRTRLTTADLPGR